MTEEAIIELAAQPEVVAIGECGLDFNRNFSTPEEQERAFVAQLRIAAELNMPVFMHCRDAHERFMTLLEPWLDKLPGAVLHCFTWHTRRDAGVRGVWNLYRHYRLGLR